MPRPPRLLLARSYYHIITRGNNQNEVFKSDVDYYYYLKLLKKYKNELPFDLYHYCLMPNHVHLLIKTRKSDDFSLFMKKINLAYYHYYHRKYGWVGHFWQDRFRSQPVGKDDYFIQCGKYIEFNPMRAGIVRKPEEYGFSSYNYYAFGEGDDLLAEDIFYEELGRNSKEKQINYQKMMIEEMVFKNRDNNVWGSAEEIYKEKRKIEYNLIRRWLITLIMTNYEF